MLKYSPYTKQHSWERTYMQLIKVSLERLMTTSKIDEIIFHGGAHIQQDFRKRILNLTASEPHPHVSAIINFARWSS